VLDCAAFAEPAPVAAQNWRVRINACGVQAVGEAPELRMAFNRETFMADPRLAGFNWERG
jgi:hypothetical protein